MKKLKYPPEVEIARLNRDSQIFHDLLQLAMSPAFQVVGGFAAVEYLQRHNLIPNVAGTVAEGAIAAPDFAKALNTLGSGLGGGIATILGALK